MCVIHPVSVCLCVCVCGITHNLLNKAGDKVVEENDRLCRKGEKIIRKQRRHHLGFPF